LFTNSLYYAIGEALPKVFGILLLPVITNYLTPEDYGLWNYVNSLVIFLFAISTLNLNTFILKYYFLEKNLLSQKKLLGNIFSFVILFNTIILFILLYYGETITSFYNISVDFYPFIFIAIIANFLNVFSIFPLALFRINGKAKEYMLLNVSKVILQYSFTLYFLIILHLDVLGLFYSLLITNIIYVCIYLYILHSNIKINIDFNQLKVALKFSLPLVPGTISYIIMSVSDRIILEQYVSLFELGIYSLAYTIGFGLNIIALSLYKTYEPTIFKKYKNKDFYSTFHKINVLNILSISIFALAISLFSKELIYYMSSESFFAANNIVHIIVISALFNGVYLLYGTLLTSFLHTKIVALFVVFSSIINILLNLYFVPIFGIYAAAYSTLISYLIMLILSMYMSYKKTVLNYFNYLIKDIMYLLITISLIYFYFFVASNNVSFIEFLIKIIGLLLYIIFSIRLYSVKLSEIIRKKHA